MGGLFDGLISWSIHNRVVVLVGAAALVAAGVWSAAHASLDVLPDFTPPFVVVQTEATGMPTLDVEQLVTRKRLPFVRRRRLGSRSCRCSSRKASMSIAHGSL
jgi:Cu/Ag efflux pump CusA